MRERSVGVVLVSYFTGPVLYQAIDSVLSQEGLDRLVIVDNGNPAAVTEWLADLAHSDCRISLLSGHGNVGYAAGANMGARAVDSDCVLFLNPDCVLPEGALVRFLEEAGRHTGLLVLGCRILNPDFSEQRGSRRATLTPWTALVETLRLDRFAPNHPHFVRLNNQDQPIPEAPCDIPAVSGACLFVAAGDFRALDGFDERYFLHVDDLDFCFQIRKNGGRVIWIPDICPVHIGATSRANPALIELYKTRGFSRYFRKNFADTYPRLFVELVCMVAHARFVARVPGLVFRGVQRGAAEDVPPVAKYDASLDTPSSATPAQ